MITYNTIVYIALMFIISSFFVSRLFHGYISQELVKDHKFKEIDGLRGVAAIGVFIHHSFYVYEQSISGDWNIYRGGHGEVVNTLYNIIINAGPVAVAIFFMITGFLFFDKLISGKGSLSPREFFIKRIYRIAPMYYFAVAAAFLASSVYGLSRVDDIWGYLSLRLGWFTFNLFPYEGFTDHVKYGRITAGVFWTLAIEWKFYLILPLLTVFCGGLISASVFVLVSTLFITYLFCFGVINPHDSSLLLCFMAGMFSACLRNYNNSTVNNILKSWVVGVFSVYLICIAIIKYPDAYNPYVIVYYFLFFICVSNGNTLLGVMRFTPLRFIGLISYSIYLMHRIILNLSVHFMGNSFGYKSMVFTAIPITIFICTTTYIFIERKFSHASKSNMVTCITASKIHEQ